MRIIAFVIPALVACAADDETAVLSPPNAEPLAGCAIACHGADTSNAPPKSVSGATATTATAVGAHQVHLTASPAWHRTLVCADCHVVPDTTGAPGRCS